VWRFLPLVLLLAATAAVFASGWHRYLSLEMLVASRDKLQAFVAENRAMALGGLALAYVGLVTLSIPASALLTTLSGFLFGWLVGGLLAVASATAGAILVVGIARTSLGDVLVRRAGPRLKGLADGFRKNAFSFLLFLRFLPVFPFWLVNLAAAVFGVPLRTFALATMIGIVPVTMTFATAGAGLEGAIVAHRDAQRACEASGGTDCARPMRLRDLVTGKILIAFGALGVLSLVPVILRRRGRPGEAD
jgi:uncharacterized membrane protein YdjX (TVP38/TMEM64 family)